MYYNGQIVHDIEKNKPTRVGEDNDDMWAWENIPTHSVRYLHKETNNTFTGTNYTIKSVKKMLKNKEIYPAKTLEEYIIWYREWNGKEPKIKKILYNHIKQKEN